MLVEVSISKTRFYVIIVEKKGSLEIPHLIDLWVQQAKRIFKEYCKSDFRKFLGLITKRYNSY